MSRRRQPSRSTVLISVVIIVTSLAAITSAYALSQSVFSEHEWGLKATARSNETLFGVFGFRAWLPQLAMLGSTIACVYWWWHLRSRGETDATVLALSVWVFPRACVHAALWLTDAPVTADFVPLEIISTSAPANILVAAIAICASILSYGMAISRTQNAGAVLLVAIPFVAMSFAWNLSYIGHRLPIDVWFTMLVLAWALAKGRSSQFGATTSLPKRKGNGWLALRSNALPLMLTLSVFITLLVFGPKFVGIAEDADPWILVGFNWSVIVLVCSASYISTTKNPSQRERREWVALTWTVAAYSLALPTVDRNPNEIPILQLPILLFPVLILFAGMLSLSLRKCTACWPLTIASVWPSVIYGVFGASLFLSESGSTPHIGLWGLFNLTAATGITFVVIHFVFGPNPRPLIAQPT